MRQQILRGTVALIVTMFALSGCSFSFSAGLTVSTEEQEKRVKEYFAEELGYEPDVECSDEIPGEVDASGTCDMTLDSGEQTEVAVTVTAVDGTDVQLNLQAELPNPDQTVPLVAASEVEQKAVAEFTEILGFTPTVTCPNNLVGELDAQLICEIEGPDGVPADLVVTVTSVDGDDVGFYMEIAEPQQ